MDLQAFIYIRRAFQIVLNNLFLLAIPVLSGYFLYFPDPAKINVSVLSGVFLALFIYMPVAYGYLFETHINGKKLSFLHIFRKHWLNVITVTFFLLITGVLIANFLIGVFFYQILFLIFAKISIIYVIPLVYFNGSGLDNIMLGLKCFFGNIGFNLPIILLSFFPMFFAVAFVGLTGKANLAVHMIACIVEFITNFTIFTAAILVLNDKIVG